MSGSAYVGQLYDARTDNILHDKFLWNSPISTNEALITSVQTDAYIEETIEDRIHHLSVDASISMSFLGGLIEVSINIGIIVIHK